MSAPDQFELLRAVVKKDVEDMVPGIVGQSMGQALAPLQAQLQRLHFDVATLDGYVAAFYEATDDEFRETIDAYRTERAESWRILTLPRFNLIRHESGQPLIMVALDESGDGCVGRLLTAPDPPPSVAALAGRTYEGKTKGDVINLAAADASKAWDEHKATTEGPRLVDE